MVTGFSIFLVPAFRVNASWAAVAFLVRTVGLAYAFIRTSRLILDRGLVLVRRSKVFFLVVLVLTLVRFLARNYLVRIISLDQTAGLFFALACDMVQTWSVSIFFEYKRLVGSAAGSFTRKVSQTS